MAIEESQYCPIHAVGRHHAQKKALAIYRIKKFQERLTEFKSANGARTLDEELALMRMVLESVINKCEDNMDLMLYSNKITDLIGEIRNLVVHADKLATKANMLIGRSEAVILAGKVVEIITKHVDDLALLNVLADEIMETFAPAPEAK